VSCALTLHFDLLLTVKQSITRGTRQPADPHDRRTCPLGRHRHTISVRIHGAMPCASRHMQSRIERRARHPVRGKLQLLQLRSFDAGLYALDTSHQHAGADRLDTQLGRSLVDTLLNTSQFVVCAGIHLAGRDDEHEQHDTPRYQSVSRDEPL
jgi:hypothetical protein